MSDVTLKQIHSRKQNNSPFFFYSLFFPPSCLLSLHVLLSSVNSLSLAPLEGDVYYLVLRPLLDFYFSLCGVCSMPLRWKNALIMISIIVLALWLKKQKNKKSREMCC